MIEVGTPQVPESVQIIAALTAILGLFKVWDGHRGKKRDSNVNTMSERLSEKLDSVQKTADSTQQTIVQVVIPRVEAAHNRITRIEKARARERESRLRELEDEARKRQAD